MPNRHVEGKENILKKKQYVQSMISWSGQAAITNIAWTGWLKQQTTFMTSLSPKGTISKYLKEALERKRGGPI